MIHKGPLGSKLNMKFGAGETFGSEFIIDGVFDIVELSAEDLLNSDFSAWAGDDPSSWNVNSEDANNKITEHADGAQIVSDGSANLRMAQSSQTNPWAIGDCVRVRFIKSNHISGVIRFSISVAALTGNLNIAGSDENGTYDIYINITAADVLTITVNRAIGGCNYVMEKASLKKVTFTNWTGWAPQATAYALTNIAYKAPSNAANLEQVGIAAEAGKTYDVTWTLAKLAGDAGDGITVEFGSTDGTLRNLSGTYTDRIKATDTDNLKFKQTDADADLECTIDTVSIKQVIN